MSNDETVTPLFRCKCGAQSGLVEIEFKGEIVGTGRMCSQCLEKTSSNLKKVRPIFKAMLDAGIDRKLANEAMTFILERHVFP